MIRKITVVAALFCCFIYHQASASKLSRQDQFIQRLVPIIKKANRKILAIRSELRQLQSLYTQTGWLPRETRQWVHTLSERYKVSNFAMKQPAAWQTLLRRIDVIPTSLTLAQAANESAWGQSRFAKQGNNFFGIWCFKAGCGLVPKQRPRNRIYEVKRFSNPLAAITAYMKNLNTHLAYRHFRQLRAQMREDQAALDSLQLVAGIENYTPNGRQYVQALSALITHYDLQQFDR